MHAFWTVGTIGVFAVLWVACAHTVFGPGQAELISPGGSARARGLLRRQMAVWEQPALRERELGRLRATNPEWDFMSRTYAVMSLANLALDEPDNRARYVGIVDRILEDTLRSEREHGVHHFLLPYSRRAPFMAPALSEAISPRSLFVDGEIAMMLALRQLVSDDPRWRESLQERVALVEAQMESGPALSAESYPDECWTFCNTMALAALRVSDGVLGTDHSAFGARWVAIARERLLDPATGMLVSSYRYDGTHLDGPEGSSIFHSAHALLLVDEAFARDQYARARDALGQEVAGFGYAREWPASRVGPTDVDSGPIVPFFDASAGASGHALVAAAAFGDRPFLASLLASLEVAAAPVRDDTGLRYGASNLVGDAVILYALVQGPAWARAQRGGAR